MTVMIFWSVRKKLLVGLPMLALLGLAVCLVALLLLPRSVIDEGHYQMIRDGMTLHEVEQILDGPGRYDATGSVEPAYSPGDDHTEKERKQDFLASSAVYLDMPGYAQQEGVRVWVGNRGMVEVKLDKEGRVRAKEFLALRRVSSNPTKIVRDWLGW
jgi:hypothetical protein